MRGKARSLERRWLVRLAAGLAWSVAATGWCSGVSAQTAAAVQGPQGNASGKPIPRFVSLKADRVNLRNGPGTEYPTSWVFSRAGMPVEIVKEFETWRQVRDAEGATGWVLQSMLSDRRTSLVLPWELKKETPPQTALRGDARESAAVVAMIEAGVIANVHSCDGRWCQVVIGNVRGYIEQNKLWGVYANEVMR